MFFGIHSVSSGIDGGTGCNFIFFRIDFVSFNRVMSEILVQLGENHEVNISSEKTETAFSIILEILKNETFLLVSIKCEIPQSHSHQTSLF